MATITGTIKKTTYHTIKIDTNDFIDKESNLNEVFDFFQSVKDSPMDFTENLIERTGTNTEIEIQSIEIKD